MTARWSRKKRGQNSTTTKMRLRTEEWRRITQEYHGYQRLVEQDFQILSSKVLSIWRARLAHPYRALPSGKEEGGYPKHNENEGIGTKANLQSFVGIV